MRSTPRTEASSPGAVSLHTHVPVSARPSRRRPKPATGARPRATPFRCRAPWCGDACPRLVRGGTGSQRREEACSGSQSPGVVQWGNTSGCYPKASRPIFFKFHPSVSWPRPESLCHSAQCLQGFSGRGQPLCTEERRAGWAQPPCGTGCAALAAGSRLCSVSSRQVSPWEHRQRLTPSPYFREARGRETYHPESHSSAPELDLASHCHSLVITGLGTAPGSLPGNLKWHPRVSQARCGLGRMGRRAGGGRRQALELSVANLV